MKRNIIGTTSELAGSSEQETAAVLIAEETVSMTDETVSMTGETVSTTDEKVSTTDEKVSTTDETVSTTDESVSTTDDSGTRSTRDTYVKMADDCCGETTHDSPVLTGYRLSSSIMLPGIPILDEGLRVSPV